MNSHWLIVLAELVAVTGLIVLFAFYAVTPARAQSSRPVGLAPPPAFAIAIRLLAQGRDIEAVERLRDVESSAAYRSTSYAPEAVYVIAHIYRDRLRDPIQAMAAYDLLATTYGLDTFPHKQAAMAERKALGRVLDAANGKHPLYKILDFFVRVTGRRSYSFALALFLISTLVRLALAPLSIRQFRSAREMQALQPKIAALQAEHKNDFTRLSTEVQELQKTHGVNPHLGWIMALLQAPVFFAVYQAVQLYQYHSGAGFLWIGGGLAAAHPQWLALDLGLPDIPLLLLYAFSMYAAQRLFPAADAAQAKMQQTMAWFTPVLYCVWIGAHHTASAFVLYWLISNILSTAIQLYGARTPRSLAPVVS
ncbi:MAG: Inner rane protein translocase component YidC [Capsulimonas sp.]|jgi:YidC/Oxa1 family membrane protein insertase|nr:Inner rane protein translocase component YidC [Capsulimonas sp.]